MPLNVDHLQASVLPMLMAAHDASLLPLAFLEEIEKQTVVVQEPHRLQPALASHS